MDQWYDRLKKFLNVDAVGRVGGGLADRTNIIDVGMIQSLNRKSEVKDIVAEYGQIICPAHIRRVRVLRPSSLNVRFSTYASWQSLRGLSPDQL